MPARNPFIEVKSDLRAVEVRLDEMVDVLEGQMTSRLWMPLAQRMASLMQDIWSTANWPSQSAYYQKWARRKGLSTRPMILSGDLHDHLTNASAAADIVGPRRMIFGAQDMNADYPGFVQKDRTVTNPFGNVKNSPVRVEGRIWDPFMKRPIETRQVIDDVLTDYVSFVTKGFD